MFKGIIKRDGRKVDYDIDKITSAIDKAMKACGHNNDIETQRLAGIVDNSLKTNFTKKDPTVEEIQDMVEQTLMENGYAYVAKKYILYRAQRSQMRERNSALMKIYNELTFSDSKESDMKRDNANIDGDTAMGTMLKYGSEGSKDYYEKYILRPEQSQAHRDGDIHIHDLDFYTLTTTCCQIELVRLFKNGFSTGHGFLREPQNISSYAALACIAIQSNQNDQHGGQSIVDFDYGLAKGVAKTFYKLYAQNLYSALKLLIKYDTEQTEADFVLNKIKEEFGLKPALKRSKDFADAERKVLEMFTKDEDTLNKIQDFTYNETVKQTDKATYKAMVALVHNLNTMHSRAGAQTPFSSINYGMDTSEEGRMVIKNVLLATEAGLGFGETPIFPIHIFRVKEGVNYNSDEPNYDLFKLACRVSAKRLFPNFSFLDAPFNKMYYKEGQPNTEIAYMGCRTRVMGNYANPDKEISYGRGNLSFTSINLPRLAIKANKDIKNFFSELEKIMDLVVVQLLDRFEIQRHKKVRNFPFLMGQGIWIDSDKLKPDDEIGEVLRNGTLSVGFIGLAEALKALTGFHHGENKESRNLGIEIVTFMRDYTDKMCVKHNLNFSLLATPAEGLSGRFVKLDRKKFGVIEGVTDREYYTNSFHIPVYYPISAYDKIKIEAPYHALTNAGHITYVELDGDTANNIEAFETIIRAMHDNNIGYGSINHPVDRDPVCGYNGIIGDVCPKCGRTENDGGGYHFERIRRITGYLVGTLDRFNDAKRAEERDRVKHSL